VQQAAISVTGRTAARRRFTQARSAMRAHARAAVAAACRACSEPLNARRSSARFCSGACRQRAWRSGMPLPSPVCHQRRIREREAALDPRPQATLEGCTVERIAYGEAKALIVHYEWLGSMPIVARACYGLKMPSGELVGVVAFAAGPAPESGDLCGREHRDLTICLARGACVHYAPTNAASFLISRACRLAAAEFGWRIFFAYADPMAGEYGAVYQAANWVYLGVRVGRGKGRGRLRFLNRRESRWRSERSVRKQRLKPADLRAHPDWIAERTPDKGRYCWFQGSKREKRRLRQLLRYEPQPYPKGRSAAPFVTRLCRFPFSAP
jgi:hypothetical protein